MKIIDLLYKIANGMVVPYKIKYDECTFVFNGKNYIDDEGDSLTEYILSDLSNINEEAKILVDDDKDIPLIPDDELFKVFDKEDLPNLNYNFKVLREKINQVVEEFNEYRREHNE